MALAMIEGAERDGLLSRPTPSSSTRAEAPGLVAASRPQGQGLPGVDGDGRLLHRGGFPTAAGARHRGRVVPSVEGRPRVNSQEIENINRSQGDSDGRDASLGRRFVGSQAGSSVTKEPKSDVNSAKASSQRCHLSILCWLHAREGAKARAASTSQETCRTSAKLRQSCDRNSGAHQQAAFRSHFSEPLLALWHFGARASMRGRGARR
jgi:hypothetical protein